MMVKDPAQRWPADRVRDDLRRIARGEPSTAPAPPVRDDQQDPDATVAMAPPSAIGAGAAGQTTTRSSEVPAVGEAPPAGHDEPTPTTRHPTPAPTPAPSRPPASDRSRGLPVGWMAAALALVLVAGLGAWLLWPRDDDPTGGSTADPSASAEPSRRGADRRAVVRAHLRGADVRAHLRGADHRAQPVQRGGRDPRSDAVLRPGLLLARHLRPGVDLRDADARVPVRERRHRGLHRLLEHDRVGDAAGHQGRSPVAHARRTRSTTSPRRARRGPSRGSCSSSSRATGSSSPARDSAPGHALCRAEDLRARTHDPRI